MLEDLLLSKEYPVEYIKWRDITSLHGWITKEELDDVNFKAVSAAIVCAEDNDSLSLTTTVLADQRFSDPIVVLKDVIIERRPIGTITI